MADKIGLIIPTLGERPEYSIQLVESIQDYQDIFEVFIVCPSEKTGQVISIFESLDSAKFIELDQVGLAQAIRAALPQMTADFWNWIGDDDLIVPSGYLKMLEIMRYNENLVLSYSNCEYIDYRDRHIAINKPGLLGIKLVYWGPNLISQPSCLFRKITTMKLDLPSARFKFAFDQELIMSLAQIGSATYVNCLSSKYRWHDVSLTSKNRIQSARESLTIRLEFASNKFSKLLVRILFLPTLLILTVSRFLFWSKSKISN